MHALSSKERARPTASVVVITLLLSLIVALPLLAGGVMLAGAGLGMRVGGIEVAVTALWARLLFLATGAFVLVDGGRVLAGPLRRWLEPSAAGKHRERQGPGRRATARFVVWTGVLVLLTVGRPLGSYEVIAGDGLFIVLVFVLLIALFLLGFAGLLTQPGSVDWAAARAIIPSGVLEKLEAGAGIGGRATIDDMHDTGMRINDQPLVRLELTVAVEGREPYQATVTETVPVLGLARLVKGGSLSVLVDPDFPEHLLVRWKEP